MYFMENLNTFNKKKQHALQIDLYLHKQILKYLDRTYIKCSTTGIITSNLI